ADVTGEIALWVEVNGEDAQAAEGAQACHVGDRAGLANAALAVGEDHTPLEDADGGVVVDSCRACHGVSSGSMCASGIAPNPDNSKPTMRERLSDTQKQGENGEPKAKQTTGQSG